MAAPSAKSLLNTAEGGGDVMNTIRTLDTTVLKTLINAEFNDAIKLIKNLDVADSAVILKKLDGADIGKILENLDPDTFKKLLNTEGIVDVVKKIPENEFRAIMLKFKDNDDIVDAIKAIAAKDSIFNETVQRIVRSDAVGETGGVLFKYTTYAGAAIGGVYLATYVGKDLADEIWNDDEVSEQRRDCLAQCMPRYYDKYLEDEIDLNDLKSPSGSLLSGGKGIQCFPDSCFPSDNRLSVENDGVAPPNRPPMDKYCTANTINTCQATCKQACEDTYQTTLEDLGEAASNAVTGTASTLGDAAGGFLGGIFGGAFDGMEWAFYVSIGVMILVFFLVVYLMFR